jgi:hypothetical protein
LEREGIGRSDWGSEMRLFEIDAVGKSAQFSGCRTWRYVLRRVWNPDRAPVAFIGLNPSTADESLDDPTIRRCVGFAKSWGFGGLVMLNLFAFRSTDPQVLREVADPIGPHNDGWIESETRRREVICCWGVHGTLKDRDSAVLKTLRGAKCLGTTKDGHPRHPLYLSKDTYREGFGGAR